MRQFSYVRPATISDALGEVAAGNGTRLIAGGTNLVDLMKLEVETPTRLVDITGLPLETVVLAEDGTVTIGALARNSDIAGHAGVRQSFPLISQALLSGASGQLRNVATAAGNLLQRTRCSYFMDAGKPCNKREPGSGCPARQGEHHNLAILGASGHCIATHPSDFAVALAVFDARVAATGPDGTRDIPLADFYLPVGDRPDREVALGPGEMVTSIVVPPLPPAARSAYRKVRERASYAFAIGSVAAVAQLDGDRMADVRIALGAVASMPWRARRAEEVLRGQRPSVEMFAAAADAELSHAEPLRDNAYKVPLTKELVVSTLAALTGVDNRPGAAR